MCMGEPCFINFITFFFRQELFVLSNWKMIWSHKMNSHGVQPPLSRWGLSSVGQGGLREPGSCVCSSSFLTEATAVRGVMTQGPE